MATAVPFVGGSSELRRKKADTQRTVNMFLSQIESGTGKAAMFLKSIPGLRRFTRGSLDIVKVQAEDEIAIGDPQTYTITATNASGVSAAGAKITDTLPPGFVFTSCTIEYVNAAGPVFATEAELTAGITIAAWADGGTVVLTVIGTFESDGPFANTATASAVALGLPSSSSTVTTTVLPPGPETDPYWEFVILHLDGESGVYHDSSPLNRTLGGIAGPVLEAGAPMVGLKSLDLSGGAVANGDGFYASVMGADEWTWRGWIKVLSLPLNAENVFASFSGLSGRVNPDGGGSFNCLINSSSYSLGAPAGTFSVGVKQFFAMTRTNNGGIGKVELFVSPDATSDAVLVGTSLTFTSSYTQDGSGDFGMIAGYGTHSYCQLDDYQLTRNVNRYRGLTSFPVPTGPLPTS